MHFVNHNFLFDIAYKSLITKGLDDYSAKCTAEGLILASLRGVDSHGIHLLFHYLKEIESGRINKNPVYYFEKTGYSTGILEADYSSGFSAGKIAIKHCMDLAEETGLGAVTVKNSNHCGMMAYYCIEPTESGYFALATTNTTPRLIPTNSKKRFFGTNPICYAFPLESEGPVCFDAATTQITGNKIKLYLKMGKQLPENVAADINGNPTSNPKIAELLYPFGNYKGMGIAMLVDILCGVLTGMPNSNKVNEMYGDNLTTKRKLGQFYLLFDINRFRNIKDFKKELQEEVNRMRVLESVGKESVMIPGDPEKLEYIKRRSNGIPIDDIIMKEINILNKQL